MTRSLAERWRPRDIYDGKKPEPQPVPSADNLWIQAGGDWARYKELLRKYAHRGDDRDQWSAASP